MLPSSVTAEAGAPALPDLGHGGRRPFVVPPLPYAESALAPAISARTVHFHYHRHHAGYVAALNRLLIGHPLAGQPLLTVIRESAGRSTHTALFNNAAQVWNHSFYWRCLTPGGGGRPGGALGAALNAGFGSYANLRQDLAAAAVGQFGSGWAWLCAEGDRLTIRRTANADTPLLVSGLTPLLVIDVWEHAYYLDYQNRRADHAAQVIDTLLNWPFANRVFEAHLRGAGLVANPAPQSSPPQSSPSPLPRPARTTDTRAATFARLARSR